eukprot:TRINITY_DN47465_c0_g1_i1.p1 TRINITY_DN47465_c0_g1~~TRINITY_DN47465_c0_g1_i1.p1  ORF type:complete len:794 (+),score=102.68 TRINITY_DN47465_c0_g1_i1:296-2677(+)
MPPAADAPRPPLFGYTRAQKQDGIERGIRNPDGSFKARSKKKKPTLLKKYGLLRNVIAQIPRWICQLQHYVGYTLHVIVQVGMLFGILTEIFVVLGAGSPSDIGSRAVKRGAPVDKTGKVAALKLLGALLYDGLFGLLHASASVAYLFDLPGFTEDGTAVLRRLAVLQSGMASFLHYTAMIRWQGRPFAYIVPPLFLVLAYGVIPWCSVAIWLVSVRPGDHLLCGGTAFDLAVMTAVFACRAVVFGDQGLTRMPKEKRTSLVWATDVLILMGICCVADQLLTSAWLERRGNWKYIAGLVHFAWPFLYWRPMLSFFQQDAEFAAILRAEKKDKIRKSRSTSKQSKQDGTSSVESRDAGESSSRVSKRLSRLPRREAERNEVAAIARQRAIVQAAEEKRARELLQDSQEPGTARRQSTAKETVPGLEDDSDDAQAIDRANMGETTPKSTRVAAKSAVQQVPGLEDDDDDSADDVQPGAQGLSPKAVSFADTETLQKESRSGSEGKGVYTDDESLHGRDSDFGLSDAQMEKILVLYSSARESVMTAEMSDGRWQRPWDADSSQPPLVSHTASSQSEYMRTDSSVPMISIATARSMVPDSARSARSSICSARGLSPVTRSQLRQLERVSARMSQREGMADPMSPVAETQSERSRFSLQDAGQDESGSDADDADFGISDQQLAAILHLYDSGSWRERRMTESALTGQNPRESDFGLSDRQLLELQRRAAEENAEEDEEEAPVSRQNSSGGSMEGVARQLSRVHARLSARSETEDVGDPEVGADAMAAAFEAGIARPSA